MQIGGVYIPFFAVYMVLCSAVAALWWRSDRRRAWGLLSITAALPVAFVLFNYTPPGAGPHAMLGWWMAVCLFLYLQGLMTWRVALLGECIAFPYFAMVVGVLDRSGALLVGDIIGIAMMLAQAIGPRGVNLVGIAGDWVASHLGGRNLVSSRPRNSETARGSRQRIPE